MADWRDRFREGSFRGVPFRTDSHEFTGGRRKQDHEFAQREQSTSEDLGLKIRTFSLTLFVLGDDYFDQRDNLIDALEKQGPGELIHPYLGRITVQAGAFTVSETVSEGRIARFNCTFSESGDNVFPDSVDDAIQNTIENAQLMQEQSKSFFEQAMNVANQPARVLDAVADRINDIADFMDDSIKKITAPIANLTLSIKNLKADAANLASKPDELATRVSDMFNELLAELEDDPEIAVKIFTNFSDFGNDIDEVVGTTPTANTTRDNQNATINFTKQQGITGESQSAVNSTFGSTNEAIGVRDDISNSISEQIFIDGIDDDLFQSLRDLQTNVVKVLPSQDLTDLISFTPKKTTPALVLAHDLTGDLNKEQEIIDNNDIEHPGFVPGGEAIEVTSG